MSDPLVTVEAPERVALRFRLASLGNRAGALMLDVVLQWLGIAAFWLLLLAMVALLNLPYAISKVMAAAAMGLSFLVRNFYFSLFEIRMQGQTPGKRLLGIRTVARDGGSLTPPLIFARNLCREVEFFLPMIAIFSPDSIFGDLPWWGRLISAIWMFAVIAVPFSNKQNCRMGDLVAGTMVVMTPKTSLLSDLTTTQEGQRAQRQYGLNFSPQQLEVYGEHELSVLEDLLRGDAGGFDPDLFHRVAQKIKRRIDWDERRAHVTDSDFLQAFYAAQRGRLEQMRLYGKRKAARDRPGVRRRRR